MSGSASNADIEDVLSSIRRLISEDVRRGRRPAEGGPDAAPPAPGPRPERLVLTDAFRVPEGEEEEEEARPAEVAPADAAGEEAAVHYPSVEAALAAAQPSAPALPGESLTAAMNGARTPLWASVRDREPLAPQLPSEAERAAADPAPEAPSEAPEEEEEAPMIDEALLRALVAEIVREELRGPLGEQITTRIRKLVRAEVRRVLDTDAG